MSPNKSDDAIFAACLTKIESILTAQPNEKSRLPSMFTPDGAVYEVIEWLGISSFVEHVVRRLVHWYVNRRRI